MVQDQEIWPASLGIITTNLGIWKGLVGSHIYTSHLAATKPIDLYV
jgi:hypothetical protein